jgi:hypothetical protein
MAKANLTLPNGTTVVIDGSPKEIAELMSLYSGASKVDDSELLFRSDKHSKSKAVNKEDKSSGKKGPQSYILELTKTDFFKQKRTISEIQKKLEERGHIYAQTSISTPLIRLVRTHELRRIKDKKSWVYVS